MAALPPVVIHGLLWIWLRDFLLRSVPRFKRTFIDYGMRLPAETEWTLGLSDWIGEYWYLLVPILLALLALDGGVSYLLYRFRKTRWVYWLWFTVMTVLPMYVGRYVFLAMYEPLLRIMGGLSE